MPSTHSLLTLLKKDYPTLTFKEGAVFRWSPKQKTIFYEVRSEPDIQEPAMLLHELSHALLGHLDYQKDVELLHLERDAWTHATQLARLYSVTINDDIIEHHLDSYRDWLHSRSICPTCNANGLQIKRSIYQCVVCMAQWHVNDARSCALRRHVTV